MDIYYYTPQNNYLQCIPGIRINNNNFPAELGAFLLYFSPSRLINTLQPLQRLLLRRFQQFSGGKGIIYL